MNLEHHPPPQLRSHPPRPQLHRHQRDTALLEHSSHTICAAPVVTTEDVRVYWDISRYDRISQDMIGYNSVYWDILIYGRISPDMIGFECILGYLHIW
jgi:hypothetical protein